MLQKSPITGKYYQVESLSLDEKLKLGFDAEAVKELKSIPEEKKSPVEKPKKEKPKNGKSERSNKST